VVLARGQGVLCSYKLLNINQEDATEEEIANKMECFKAMIMIHRADNTRFGDLKKSLDASTYLGRDEYPVNTTTAYNLLQSTSSSIENNHGGHTRGQLFRNRLSNVMFEQKGQRRAFDPTTAVPGRDGKIYTRSHVTIAAKTAILQINVMRMTNVVKMLLWHSFLSPRKRWILLILTGFCLILVPLSVCFAIQD
jgi:hypothetical protein